MSQPTIAVALPSDVPRLDRSVPPPFGHGLLSQIVFHRTYARVKADGSPETWHDVVERVITGLWSIFVGHMRIHRLPFDQSRWTEFVGKAMHGMFEMKWTPPGRGLWMMGTDFVYSHGATALNNCAAVSTKSGLVESAAWAMDALMNGGGVGFDTEWVPPEPRPDPRWSGVAIRTVPDSREGWVWSVKLLLNAHLRELPEIDGEFTEYPIFDYSAIRKRGEPIKGFGGIASGPEPLIKLHRRLRCFLDLFFPPGEPRPDGVSARDHFLRCIAEIDYPGDADRKAAEFIANADARFGVGNYSYDSVRLVADIFNSIGDCVVSGNVRRSSEIAIGRPDSTTFRLLKDYRAIPERASIAHNSNNSIRFTATDQYTEYLPAIAEGIRMNGEPGLIFQLNISRYGRVARPPLAMTGSDAREGCGMRSREFEPDAACLSNPCGEICLESHEFCNLSEVSLNRFLRLPAAPTSGERAEKPSFDMAGFLEAVEYATFYCKCVSILPCQSEESNAVIARNRRIGVSLSGISAVYDALGATRLIDIFKTGYRRVRDFDASISGMLGVVPSIRVTTCKPSGTISLLTGATPGVHFPIAGKYVKRRVIIGNTVPLTAVLKAAGVENEPSVNSVDGTCFTFYLDNGNARPQSEVSLYEMLTLVATVQREWADNMVSATVTFDPESEGPRLEQAIANFAPVLKSCAFLPLDCGAYRQMPYEAISREEYERGIAAEPHIDIAKLLAESGHQLETPEMPKYCDGASCELRPRPSH